MAESFFLTRTSFQFSSSHSEDKSEEGHDRLKCRRRLIKRESKRQCLRRKWSVLSSLLVHTSVVHHYGESENHGPESLGSILKGPQGARTQKVIKSGKKSYFFKF